MLRVQVMNGEINRSATKDEIIKMQNILENALIDGSIGLSTGPVSYTHLRAHET